MSVEFIHPDARERKMKTNQKTLTDLWENIKYIHVHEMGDTGEKRQELKTV